MITFKLDTGEFQRFVKNLSSYDKTNIHKGFGFIIENEVVRKINDMGLVDKGAFKNSVNHSDYDEERVIVQDGVKYGKYLEFGTKPHFIAPKFKKALHWGGEYFSKGHMVSGIREYAPFRKGLIASIKEMEDFALKKLKKVIS